MKTQSKHKRTQNALKREPGFKAYIQQCRHWVRMQELDRDLAMIRSMDRFWTGH